jgi:DNA-binding response OmpR family regulator
MFILSEALGEEGFKVLAATNGTEALTLYRQHADKVSLAIVDVMLPGMDGLTVATEMRKINDDLFLLFMSGYDTEEIRGGVIGDIPNAQFFRKPFSFENMIKRIRDLS